MLTAILRPFAHLSAPQFGAAFTPRQRCYTHANRLMSLVWSYRSLAILRTDYWIMHPIATAAFIVLDNLQYGSEEVDTLVRAGRCLREMAEAFPLATDYLATIHAAFHRARVSVPGYAARYFEEARHRKEGLMHRAPAALLPAAMESEDGDGEESGSKADATWGPSFQELLDALDDASIVD